MNRLVFVILMFAIAVSSGQAQKYFSKTGAITFHSDAPLEKIEATNGNANIVIDAATGAAEMSVLIKGFKFEKALMQEHFNENYMESNQYPKAVFKGTVSDLGPLRSGKDGEFPVTAKGNLTMHGVTKPVTVNGNMIIKGDAISVSGRFDVVIADYNIDVPKVVRDNIAKTVTVSVQSALQKM